MSVHIDTVGVRPDTHQSVAVDLAPVLGSRRWLRRRSPIPHVMAYDVFAPHVYRELEASFLDLLAETAGKPYMQRHNIYGRTVDEGIAHRFEPLLTRAFLDVLASVLGLRATGQVAVGMHHHQVGGKPGFPHNDLNPGWFLREAPPGELVFAGPGVDYTTGALLNGSQGRAVETVRAASMLFYLANPRWEPGDGGATGLYRRADDDIGRPAGSVPPINNSMLLFECTPTSYHGFIGNRRQPRNSIVMWLHRDKQEVIDRWGEGSIVPYGLTPRRRTTS